ncbi:salmochelin biosynthesis C-glycosyltransferase IroB [Rugosimonospora acidiphila]|uniref:Salmochelin biosynthesis C-glycosyltransferase IroB n=1 Tax=Rugosimonospora acidiphila TaxID=556531 RepID=A0ABP9SBI2_9ACTN
MRILFVSAPLVGHLFPMLPLALAARDAGHEVMIASGGEAADAFSGGEAAAAFSRGEAADAASGGGAASGGEAAVGRSGCPPVEDLCPGFDFGAIARRVMLRHPLIARAELAGTAGTRGVALLFGAVNEALAGPVERLVADWAPDLVVHEPLAVAGALAAARAGIPAVLHGNSLFDGEELTRVTAAAMRHPPARRLPPHAGVLTIAPASVAGTHSGRPMRPVPYGGGALPGWLRESPSRPRILVSRSTVAGPGGGDPMPAVIAAAARIDAEIVLVRPDARAIPGALPGNVRVVGWIPVAEALPTCAGIVHHGGAGTVLAALAAGVPQLVVPGPGDRRYNAQRVAARGAGLAVPARRLTADHLWRLATDPTLARAAGQVREEIEAMPAPAELVAELPGGPA